MVNGYSARQYGIVGPKITRVTVIISEKPGPLNERAVAFDLSQMALDEEFHTGGSRAVRAFLERVIGEVVGKAVDEIARDYETEEREKQRADKGPLGFIHDIGIALHEHRTGRSQRDAARRDLPPDVQL